MSNTSSPRAAAALKYMVGVGAREPEPEPEQAPIRDLGSIRCPPSSTPARRRQGLRVPTVLGDDSDGDDSGGDVVLLCSPVRNLLSTGSGSELDGLRSHAELEARLLSTPEMERRVQARRLLVDESSDDEPPRRAAAAAARDQPGGAAAARPSQQQLEDELREMRLQLELRDDENRRLLAERNRAKASAFESREQLLSLSAEISAEAIEQVRVASPVSAGARSIDSVSIGSDSHRRQWSERREMQLDVNSPLQNFSHSSSHEERSSNSPDSLSEISDGYWAAVRRRRTGSDMGSDVTESDITALTLHDIRARSTNLQALTKVVFSDFEVLHGKRTRNPSQHRLWHV